MGEDEPHPAPAPRRMVDERDDMCNSNPGKSTESRSNFSRKEALETLNVDGNSKREVRMRHVTSQKILLPR